MNPCPCGYLGDRERECTCPAHRVRQYRVAAQRAAARPHRPARRRAARAAARAARAAPRRSRRRRSARASPRRASASSRGSRGTGAYANAHMTARQLRRCAGSTPTRSRLLDRAYERLQLSARACDRVVKVAQTIADLDGRRDDQRGARRRGLAYRGRHGSASMGEPDRRTASGDVRVAGHPGVAARPGVRRPRSCWRVAARRLAGARPEPPAATSAEFAPLGAGAAAGSAVAARRGAERRARERRRGRGASRAPSRARARQASCARRGAPAARHVVTWADAAVPAVAAPARPTRRCACSCAAARDARRGRARGSSAVVTPVVAVVGTRRPSPYGREMARAIARDLTRAGVLVVSGLALGIDAVGAEAARRRRPRRPRGSATVAVLGCGADVVHPRSNAGCSRACAPSGLLVSEFTWGVRRAPWRFPARNRVMAGLAQAVVVVEGAERSGARITAGYAARARTRACSPCPARPGEQAHARRRTGCCATARALCESARRRPQSSIGRRARLPMLTRLAGDVERRPGAAPRRARSDDEVARPRCCRGARAAALVHRRRAGRRRAACAVAEAAAAAQRAGDRRLGCDSGGTTGCARRRSGWSPRAGPGAGSTAVRAGRSGRRR